MAVGRMGERRSPSCARWAAAFAVAVGLVGPGAAAAQIVNVLPRLGSLSEGLHGAIGGGVDFRRGNANLFVVRGDGQLAYRDGAHLLLVFAHVEFGTKSGDRFLFNSFEHLRYRVAVHAPLSWEVFAQHDFNQFRRLSLRVVGGTGPHVELWAWEGGSLVLGTAYMAEYEVLGDGGADPPPADAGERTLAHRWSSYLALEAQVAEALELRETVYVQPRFDAFSDVRVLGTSTVAVTVEPPLRLDLSFTLAYDAAPPEAVEALDLALQAGVSASF